jgi:protein SCO1/2
MKPLAFGTVVVFSAAITATAVTALVMHYRPRQGAAPANPPAARELDVLYDAPAFSLIDQDGTPFSSETLKDKVWLADFIFTRCAGPCPIMTDHLRDVQKALGNAGVQLISFSLDPANDTPAVLKDYAKTYAADESTWRLLTGDAQAIYHVAKGLKMGAIPASGAQGIEHDTHFVLVDQAGKVRGYYSGQDDEGWKKAAEDAANLSKGSGIPPSPSPAGRGPG